MSAESRARRAMARFGLKLSDFSPNERFAAILHYALGIDMGAIDDFIRNDAHWDHSTTARNREELRQLRTAALHTYARGNIDLAVMTARLLHCEARLIGMRIVADPVMVKHKKAKKQNADARRISAARRTKLTVEKYKAALKCVTKKYGKPSKKAVAVELGVSPPTLRKFLRERMKS